MAISQLIFQHRISSKLVVSKKAYQLFFVGWFVFLNLYFEMSILPKQSPLYETFENSIKFGNNIYLFIKASSSKVPSQVPDNYELSLNHFINYVKE